MEIKIHAMPLEKDGHKYLRILSPVRVSNPVPGGTVYADFTALWDTGATNTCIPFKAAEALHISLGELSPVTKMKAAVPSRRCQFYLEFPGAGRIFVKEALAVHGMQADFIIGMDVMRHGRTTIEPDGEGGVRFTFSI